MKVLEIFMFVFILAIAILIGYALAESKRLQEPVGSSVVVNGDTLRIVEWTKLYDMYVLENGLVYRLKEK
jgi:hypothetical protein